MLIKSNKHRQKLKAAAASRSEFFIATSHELKSPITPMKIQLDLILEGSRGKFTNKQKQSLEIISRNLERLNRLLSDLLLVSKLEGRKIKYELEYAQLANYIKEALENFRAVANAKKIKIKSNMPQLPKIYIDGLRISQVLTNLLDNAVKFTPKNGEIALSAKKQKSNILVRLSHDDVGIQKEHFKKIFEPFYQIDLTTPKKQKGTGLGLNICRRIIEDHGGKIWAESNKEKHITFYFTLPIRK